MSATAFPRVAHGSHEAADLVGEDHVQAGHVFGLHLDRHVGHVPAIQVHRLHRPSTRSRCTDHVHAGHDVVDREPAAFAGITRPSSSSTTRRRGCCAKRRRRHAKTGEAVGRLSAGGFQRDAAAQLYAGNGRERDADFVAGYYQRLHRRTKAAAVGAAVSARHDRVFPGGDI